MAIARYTLAVDRRFRRDGEARCRFYSRVFLLDVRQSLLRSISVRELKIAVTGRIQTGSYTNRDGQKVYTTEVVVEDQEFAESKASSDSYAASASAHKCTGGIHAEPGQPLLRAL